MRSEGDYYWDSTGEFLGPYTNWDQGEPYSSWDCVYWDSRSGWITDLCQLEYFYICEAGIESKIKVGINKILVDKQINKKILADHSRFPE